MTNIYLSRRSHSGSSTRNHGATSARNRNHELSRIIAFETKFLEVKNYFIEPEVLEQNFIETSNYVAGIFIKKRDAQNDVD